MLCRTTHSVSFARSPGVARASSTTTQAFGSKISAAVSKIMGTNPYASKKWWDENTVAVVTGANKGIGKEIAGLLKSQGLTVIATTRDVQRGGEALKDLSQVPGGKLEFHELDVSSPDSIKAFKTWLQATYGNIDILVNNAGMAYKGDIFGAQELRNTLATNYHGTALLTDELLPLIRPGQGRVVTVSSRAGQSGLIRTPQLRDKFMKASSKQEIDELVNQFVSYVDKADYQGMAAAGWPKSMYGISKLAISMYCRSLAERLGKEGTAIKVAACCPGWCITDMSSGRGNKTAAQGADTPVWLALTHADDLPSGLLWGERSQVTY